MLIRFLCLLSDLEQLDGVGQSVFFSKTDSSWHVYSSGTNGNYLASKMRASHFCGAIWWHINPYRLQNWFFHIICTRISITNSGFYASWFLYSIHKILQFRKLQKFARDNVISVRFIRQCNSDSLMLIVLKHTALAISVVFLNISNLMFSQNNFLIHV